MRPDVSIDFESDLEKRFRIALNNRGLMRNRDYVLQYPTKIYIIDFAFPNEGLAVEVDGFYHQTPRGRKRDYLKNKYLREQGWNILRFSGDEIDEDLESCIDQVMEFLGNNHGLMRKAKVG